MYKHVHIKLKDKLDFMQSQSHFLLFFHAFEFGFTPKLLPNVM